MSAATGKIAFLGTGRMGAPIVRNLLKAGFEVSAWNRTRERAAPLAEDGAQIASTPAEAAGDAAVAVTMLADGEAVEQTMSGPDGALAALPPQSVWVQMATVGLEWAARLGELAGTHEVLYVDAPVSGSDQPARDAELVILGSGAEEARDRVQPIFDAISRQTLWLGAAGNGTRFKLALNNWLVTQVEALAETVAMAESLGLDSRQVVETIADGPLGSPYSAIKGREMIEGEFEAGFPLRHAYKDAALVLDAGRESGLDLPLTAALAPRWEQTVSDGHGTGSRYGRRSVGLNRPLGPLSRARRRNKDDPGQDRQQAGEPKDQRQVNLQQERPHNRSNEHRQDGGGTSPAPLAVAPAKRRVGGQAGQRHRQHRRGQVGDFQPAHGRVANTHAEGEERDDEVAREPIRGDVDRQGQRRGEQDDADLDQHRA